MHGGPFFELQKRLGLLGERSLRVEVRAALFIGLAWLMPLVLSLPDPLRFLADPGAWAKFMIGVSLFVVAERQVEFGLASKIGQFSRVPLIPPDNFDTALKAVATARRRRDSGFAELVCALFGILISFVALGGASPAAWAAAPTPEGTRITLAGLWVLLVSLPLFGFLFLRILWRHVVWALLLKDLAPLDLRLVATRPDGKGGLAFLGSYPNAFMLFVLGASAAVASAIVRHMVHEKITVAAFSSITGAWLLIVLALFAVPLQAFSRPLNDLKESSLLAFGAEATRFQRAAERKAIGQNVSAFSTQEVEQDREHNDVSKQYEASRKLFVGLLNRSAVLLVAAAALLPFAAAGATKLPLKEVLSVLKELLVL